jgi:hypothetical protein
MFDDPFAVALRLLVDRLVREFQPARVILFGSRARGDAGPDSDIDLLVVMPDMPEDPWALSAAMRRSVGAIGLGKDFVITDLRRFAERSCLAGTVEEMAAREGVVLHAAA